jgi:hypothetical protein
MTVWQLLARLGHRGERDGIIQHVFEAASRVTLKSADGGTVEGGDFLVETFEALGTTSPDYSYPRRLVFSGVFCR